MARLRPLRDLDLDHFDLRVFGLLDKSLRIKLSVFIATSEVSRSNLPDEMATMFAVVHRHTAFAGVMGKPAECGALIEG
jgi:hypothetical protein